ncbi:hypothetical protein F4805DRAFT_472071 [Annulohypoxylon moriforme]|nr:hypothetical protein F4805DRAFT_472071 [Annulohypoxylon moriforme]
MKMAFHIHSLWLFIGLFALRALAQCSSFGVDYVNGGSYDIDSSSNNNFTFTTIFQGCDQETVTPLLIDPKGIQYPCSAVNTTPSGEQVTSTCGITFSAMASGLYKIIMQGENIGVQRTIALTAGTPATITFTATPTVIVGITSTPNATTVYKTIEQTQTITLKPGTVKAPCDGITQTVTITPVAPTVTTIYTITRTITDKKTTKHTTTTLTKTASCHYLPAPTWVPDPIPSICIGLACIPPILPPGLIGNPGSPIGDTALETGKPDKVAARSLAATTITVTETTVTVTSTSFTTVPASTTTEDVYQTTTATITPPPTTVCDDERPPATTTVTRPVGIVTQTDVTYDTTHIKATVWIGETKYKTSTDKDAATSCMDHGVAANKPYPQYIAKTFELAAPNLSINGMPVDAAHFLLSDGPADAVVFEPFDARKRARVEELSREEEDLLRDIAALKKSMPGAAAQAWANAACRSIADDEQALTATNKQSSSAKDLSVNSGAANARSPFVHQDEVEASYANAVAGLARLKREMPSAIAKIERAKSAGEYVITEQ